ncbi:sulfhydryl oxidase 2-like [Drosophila innubila]|uniref:sulfhydryl oxidase 2-like n=1 Tax=Drosophila innubila TaxID=198719 RepID=UPI00148D0DD9|nr:sulfhydryl oxidase 2-like [Drosophila innubila]
MIRSLKLLVLALLLAVCVVHAVIEPSLYSPDDNVKILNNDSLEIELYNSSNCNFVQFYNYFCGDCRRYAATFKKLSWKLYDWRRVLSVLAVDCAQEINVKICRDYHIRQTPTLIVFPPHFQRTENDLGFEIDKREPDEIISTLAEYISKIKFTQQEHPNFEPINKTENVFTADEDLTEDCKSKPYTVLVYQPLNSTIGRDLILELLTWPMVTVRIVDNRALLGSLGLIPESDELAIMDCVGNVSPLEPENSTLTAYVASATRFLQSANYQPVAPLVTTQAPTVAKYFIDEEQQAIISTVLSQQPKVYRADLEQAIDSLLHTELPKVPVFKGDNMLALQQLINVLRLFNPLNASGKLLLDRIYTFVNSIGNNGELSGVAFQLQVQNLEKKLPKVFKSKRYVGCIGSGPFLRGFTCSIWTLFHFLSVESSKTAVLPPGAVLRTLHGFVQHFFGCKDCVQHFLGMAERRKLFSVNTYDAEILWLWEAHNEVNQRLAGDSTEDPKFPKQQYPGPDICGKCYDTTWSRNEVLSFFKAIYDRKNLSTYGLPTPIGYD